MTPLQCRDHHAYTPHHPHDLHTPHQSPHYQPHINTAQYAPYRPHLHATPNGPSSSPDPWRWAEANRTRALARVRGPMVTVAQRIGLSSARCEDLQRHLGRARHALLNPPRSASGDRIWALEERVFRLEQLLHQERLALWKDLSGLLQPAKDAAVESMRQGWLRELGRVFEQTAGDAQ